MNENEMMAVVEKTIEENNGMLFLRPSLVARSFLPPGRRLGLDENEYDKGERGFICERWIGSETKADNAIGPADEGLSYLDIPGYNVLLTDAVRICGQSIMGADYSRSHKSLGRLPKIYDYSTRVFFHIHQSTEFARRVGKNPKEEAYYFLEEEETGIHPETFFGVHPYIVEGKIQVDTILPYLVEWNSDLILRHSRAYLNVPGEGFHLPAGVPHAPGTALTLELQEASDVFGVLQAKVNGKIVSKELLFKDICEEDREKYGERSILNQIDWAVSGDPYFYENRHTRPIKVDHTKQEGGFEEWIFYNTTKFSGKKLTVKPKSKFKSVDKGLYTVYVRKGIGKIDGHRVEGNNFSQDEVLVVHQKATKGFTIENIGTGDLILFKLFGPDINEDVPFVKYQTK